MIDNNAEEDRVGTFRLEDCSLMVFSGSAFEDYWHGILSRHAPGECHLS